MAVAEIQKQHSGKTRSKAKHPVASQHPSIDGRETKIGRRNKELGRRGEEAAARYLYRRGYQILERNWECFAGEADIIAQDGDALVFVEVKTRKDCQKGFPSEAVNAKKRERYEKIALAYLSGCESMEAPIRFDVISIVVMGKDKAMVRHQINAFSVI